MAMDVVALSLCCHDLMNHGDVFCWFSAGRLSWLVQCWLVQCWLVQCRLVQCWLVQYWLVQY